MKNYRKYLLLILCLNIKIIFNVDKSTSKILEELKNDYMKCVQGFNKQNSLGIRLNLLGGKDSLTELLLQNTQDILLPKSKEGTIIKPNIGIEYFAKLPEKRNSADLLKILPNLSGYDKRDLLDKYFKISIKNTKKTLAMSYTELHYDKICDLIFAGESLSLKFPDWFLSLNKKVKELYGIKSKENLKEILDIIYEIVKKENEELSYFMLNKLPVNCNKKKAIKEVTKKDLSKKEDSDSDKEVLRKKIKTENDK